MLGHKNNRSTGSRFLFGQGPRPGAGGQRRPSGSRWPAPRTAGGAFAFARTSHFFFAYLVAVSSDFKQATERVRATELVGDEPFVGVESDLVRGRGRDSDPHVGAAEIRTLTWARAQRPTFGPSPGRGRGSDPHVGAAEIRTLTWARAQRPRFGPSRGRGGTAEVRTLCPQPPRCPAVAFGPAAVGCSTITTGGTRIAYCCACIEVGAPARRV